MTEALPLILLRHGTTDWNAEKRLQGRHDRPLNAAGRVQVAAWKVDPAWQSYRWVTSPLKRARETAALLGHDDATNEAALIEMCWGDWEGATLVDLRMRDGIALKALEARGLDFRPPKGESPRDLQARLRPWLADLARDEQPTVAVCHKGVIRALYALAVGWNMTDEPPEKLRDDCAQCFLLALDGTPRPHYLNWPLLP